MLFRSIINILYTHTFASFEPPGLDVNPKTTKEKEFNMIEFMSSPIWGWIVVSIMTIGLIAATYYVVLVHLEIRKEKKKNMEKTMVKRVKSYLSKGNHESWPEWFIRILTGLHWFARVYDVNRDGIQHLLFVMWFRYCLFSIAYTLSDTPEREISGIRLVSCSRRTH